MSQTFFLSQNSVDRQWPTRVKTGHLVRIEHGEALSSVPDTPGAVARKRQVRSSRDQSHSLEHGQRYTDCLSRHEYLILFF